MTDHAPLPVAGYTPQNDERIALANEGMEMEERYLRWLDKLQSHVLGPPPQCDARWRAPKIRAPKSSVWPSAMWRTGCASARAPGA